MMDMSDQKIIYLPYGSKSDPRNAEQDRRAMTGQGWEIREKIRLGELEKGVGEFGNHNPPPP